MTVVAEDKDASVRVAVQYVLFTVIVGDIFVVVVVVAATAAASVVGMVVAGRSEQGRGRRKVSSLIVFYDEAVYNTADQQKNAFS